MPNNDFLEKDLGLVSETYFMYNFSKKYFSCFILLYDQISLSDWVSFIRHRVIKIL